MTEYNYKDYDDDHFFTEEEIQFLNKRELEDAMVHPEKYPTLIVRVSGFSAVFVKLTRNVQEELLSRVLYDEDSFGA